jgi:murein DD-endopeptidase MepM/ murein hydrolase activator NlpD
MLAAASAVVLACTAAAQAHDRGPAGPLRTFSELSEAASRPVWIEQLERRELAKQGGAAPAFPVVGAHDYGTAENRFGGARDHGGQDVLAPCGEPVVAALGGKVTDVKYEGAAGNYTVVRAGDGTSEVYMHLRDAASVRPGERVAAGERIGRVGQTGDASTCHLHFELWTAPGWYAGGHAIDPLPALRRWDAAHSGSFASERHR